MSKKISTRDLVQKIETLTKQRMAEEKVVSLKDFQKSVTVKKSFSILVIEDDETQRKALCRLFIDEGFQVISASDGVQLSQLLDAQPIDLIILDVGLPWINGYELAEMMKDHDDLQDIPLIFISGAASAEDMKKGFAVGADDYIKKPFDLNQIKKAVNALLPVKS